MYKKDDNDIFLMQKLGEAKRILNADPINLNDLKRTFDSFCQQQKKENYDYMKDLFDPINRKGVKMPSKIPTPSCSFQLHNETVLYTNNYGLNITAVNPFCLSSIQKDEEIPYRNGLPNYAHLTNLKKVRFGTNACCAWVFDDIGKDGEQKDFSEYSWDPLIDFNCTIPPIYTSYRVVSACARLKYIGCPEEAQGVLGCGIFTSGKSLLAYRGYVVSASGSSLGTVARVPADIVKFGLVNEIQKLPYFKEYNILEGVQSLYFPLDETFERFYPVASKDNVYCSKGIQVDNNRVEISFKGPGNFFWIFYIYGGPRNTGFSFKLEYWINYECTPDPKFMNYIPVSLNAFKGIKLGKNELAKVMGERAISTILKINNIDYFIV